MSNILPSQDQPFVSVTQSRRQRFWAFPITRIVLYLIVLVLIVIVFSVVANGTLMLLHHRHGHDQVAHSIFNSAMSAASVVLAFWIMVRFVDKRPWATAGFTATGLLRGLLGGFLIGATLLSVGIGLSCLFGVYHVTALRPLTLLFIPVVLYLGVSVFEEILFRGYLFQTLEARWGSGVALTTSCLLFGLAHLGNRVQGVTPWERLSGPLFICLEAGLLLGAAYLLTRSWWLPIGIHWAWDYCEGPIYGCPDSGTHDPHTLLQSHFARPFLLTGGPFGPESGLIFLAVGTATGLILLRTAVRNGQWKSRPQVARSKTSPRPAPERHPRGG